MSVMTVKDSIEFDQQLYELLAKIKKADGLQRNLLVKRAIERLRNCECTENTKPITP